MSAFLFIWTLFGNKSIWSYSTSSGTFLVSNRNDFLHNYRSFVSIKKYLPGIFWAIIAHLFPIESCIWKSFSSYYFVHSVLTILASKWLWYLDKIGNTFPYIVFHFCQSFYIHQSFFERWYSTCQSFILPSNILELCLLLLTKVFFPTFYYIINWNEKLVNFQNKVLRKIQR